MGGWNYCKNYYLGSRLVALRKGTTLEYLHQDHLGGSFVSTDSAGAQKAGVAYYPFGGTRASSGTLGTDRKFTGQRLDLTGLYYYGARYYDLTLGRFLRRAPVAVFIAGFGPPPSPPRTPGNCNSKEEGAA